MMYRFLNRKLNQNGGPSNVKVSVASTQQPCSSEEMDDNNDHTKVDISSPKINEAMLPPDFNKNKNERIAKCLNDDEGLNRFAYDKGQRYIDEKLFDLTPGEQACVHYLKNKWDTKHKDVAFDLKMSLDMCLNFARNCPGKKPFDKDMAWKFMKNYDEKYLLLSTVDELFKKQLLTKTLFPLPGLRTKNKCHETALRTIQGGHDVFYMRPCRYFPKYQSRDIIIENLIYVIQCMIQNEYNSIEGISFLANMTGWKMENFNLEYCSRFMQVLQGNIIPIKINLFLIVNPPTWFDAVWKIMKKMLSRTFIKKVKIISELKLSKYLQDGYEQYLPNEMETGKANTKKLVQDFVNYRNLIEKEEESGIIY